MSIFGSSSGGWWYSSLIDPRWNKSGHVEFLSALVKPREAEEWLQSMIEEHGEPPADLVYGQMKD